MATPKTWTAHDIQQGKLTIYRVAHPETGAPALQVERRYVFVDDQGAVLESIAGGRVLATIEIADLPQGVASALQTIDAWMYQQALAQEEMDG